MVVERTASFGKLHLKGIVASVGLTAGLLVLIFPLPELESPARIQLALTLGALSFWASGVMPAPITGMLYMGLLLITNSSDPLTVFSGWTNEGGSLWLVLCAFLIASGVERSGLARRAALSICASGQVKGFQSLIAAIAVIELLFALIIPSAFARTFVILAVAKEVCKENSVSETDAAVINFACFALAVPTTLIFLTSEPALNTLVVEYSELGLSWVGWFSTIGIPNIIYLFLVTVLFIRVFKPSGKVFVDGVKSRASLEDLGRLSPKEKKMALWLSLMIAFWLPYPFMGIGIAWGTMLLTSLMFLPRIGVLDAKAFADVPVGTLVFLTCALSIGSVGEATGMSQWIADTALPASLPSDILSTVIFISAISLAIHTLIGSVLATAVVIFPILISFGDVAGLGVSDAGAVLIAYQMIASQFFLSMHQAPIASGMELAGYGEKTVMKLGAPMTCLALVQQVLVTGWLFLADVL